MVHSLLATSLLPTRYSQLATSPLWLASLRPEGSAITDRGYRICQLIAGNNPARGRPSTKEAR